MEKQTHQQITAKTICDAIGRQVIADHIGAKLTSVSNASVSGKFPAYWYPGIRELCRKAGQECPDAAFSFLEVKPIPRGTARKVRAAQ